MSKTYWIVIDDGGFQRIEQGEDLDDLYNTCDYFIQAAVKIDGRALKELKEQENEVERL